MKKLACFFQPATVEIAQTKVCQHYFDLLIHPRKVSLIAHAVRLYLAPGVDQVIEVVVSVQAITWAYQQRISQASRKFVLVTLANYADRESCCYPSVQTLCLDTGLDRKTILACLHDLAQEFIEDTGKRKGLTHSVKVWRLVGCHLPEKLSQNGDSLKQSQKRDGIPFFPPSSPVFPMKQSQKRDTDPKGNRQEPGEGRPQAKKFVKEIEVQIQKINARMTLLKQQGAHENAHGLQWHDSNKLSKYKTLKARRTELEDEQINL